MPQIIKAINQPPQRESDHSLAFERDQYPSDFTLYTGQFEIADILENLNNIVITASIGTKSIIDSVIHAANSAFWVSYGDWGSFTIPSEEQHPSLVTFESPSRNRYIKYKILQKPLLDRLEALRNKVRGYKESDDIEWPTDQACEEAKNFILHLPLHEIHAPEIFFAHDGEVNFLWEMPDSGIEVDLGFYGDGTYSYFATDDRGNKLKRDDVSVDQELPGDLAEMLGA